MKVVPLRTHILTDKDDLMEVIETYALPHMAPGDIFTIVESVVAILQGRFVRPDQVKVSLAAKTLSRFINQDGSLSSPYAMEVVMREEGKARVIGAFLAGAVCHVLLRRRGVFYRLAGAQASLVDDVTGTMPPFDKFIVLGPKDPKKVVADIKRRFKVEAAIIDANDLGKVKIVAATEKVSLQLLEEVFRSNPAGNADQQTPLVLIKKD